MHITHTQYAPLTMRLTIAIGDEPMHMKDHTLEIIQKIRIFPHYYVLGAN